MADGMGADALCCQFRELGQELCGIPLDHAVNTKAGYRLVEPIEEDRFSYRPSGDEFGDFGNCRRPQRAKSLFSTFSCDPNISGTHIKIGDF